jgi:hypothetical protein
VCSSWLTSRRAAPGRATRRFRLPTRCTCWVCALTSAADGVTCNL